jgi:hypothetical protein
MKKKYYLILILLLLVIVPLVKIVPNLSMFHDPVPPEGVPSDYYEVLDTFSTNFEPTIIVYGDRINYPNDIKNKKVDSLSLIEDLYYGEHKFLIINMSAETEFELSEEEIEKIVDYRKNHGVNILFIGLSKYDYLREYGILDDYQYEGKSVVYLMGGDPEIHKMLPSTHGTIPLNEYNRVYFSIKVMLDLIELSSYY